MSAPVPPLHELRAPGEEDARRRAWPVARAALAERSAIAPARRLPRHGRGPAAALAVLLAGTVLALGLTAPGRATAEWVRQHLSEVTGRDAPPTRAASRYGPLPGGGRLLAVNDQGLFAFGLPGNAPRELLGRIDAATWSPHGRFVAAVRGIELIAVDLRGRRHWSLPAAHPIRWPAWSPSGFRVAYVVGRGARDGGRTIRVVAGDGSGDRPLAASGPTPPVWQPGVAPAERLATVDSAGRVALRDADSGRVLWRTRLYRAPLQLAWTAGGRRLLVLERRRVVTLDAGTGARVGQSARQADTINLALAARPGHHGYAVIRRAANDPRDRVAVVRTDASGRRVRDTSSVLFAGGPIRAIAWSPRGDWLAADLAGVDGWDLVHVRGRGVDRVRTLGAGRGARLAGWCCG